MARVVVYCMWSLLLFACAGREPPRSGQGEGEGEGEGEGDLETDSVQLGGACHVDSDCDGFAECLRGFCAITSSYCVDDTHAWSAAAADEVSDEVIIDCALWGGWCESERGCLFPEGSECLAHSFCGAEDGSWPCPAHRVCDNRPARLSSPAFPEPITLPATVTFEATGRCVVVEFDAPGGIVATPPAALRLYQGAGFNLSVPVREGFQVDAGPLVICGRPDIDTTVSLELVAFDDVRLGSACIDDTRYRQQNNVQTCPEGTTCTTRLEPFARCLGHVGDPCPTSCVGSCVNDGVTHICTAERIPHEAIGTCDGSSYRSGHPGGLNVSICSERCLDNRGCVVQPGHACFDYELCIDPVTLDDLFACPEGGICPEEEQ